MAIKINIGSLNDGSQTLDLVSDSKELGLAENLLKDSVYVTLDLFKTVHQLDIKGKITGTLNMECDRCLEIFEKKFESDFELVYVQKSAREEPVDDDYIRTYNPFMKQVDITVDIKEIIILAVPMKKLPEEKTDGSCSWCRKSKDYWDKIIIDEEELKKINN
jgi:uncharacterized metal-binding protein YceD (DUF177 family)